MLFLCICYLWYGLEVLFLEPNRDVLKTFVCGKAVIPCNFVNLNHRNKKYI